MTNIINVIVGVPILNIAGTLIPKISRGTFTLKISKGTLDPPNWDTFIPKIYIDRTKCYRRNSNPKYSRDIYNPKISRETVTPKIHKGTLNPPNRDTPITKVKIDRTNPQEIGTKFKKQRRKIRQFEAVDELIHKGIKDIRAAGEKKTNGTWKTPQRKLSWITRRKIGRQFKAEEQIYKGTEDIEAAGEEQKTNKTERTKGSRRSAV